MRVKYVIHRSKGPFKHQKDMFRDIINFHSKQYPGLQFVDKGLRFSAVNGDTVIDFDFGYLNMRYRDFSGYHLVISQGTCGLLADDMKPGDLVFPTQSDMLRINNDCTKVRVYERTARCNNRMGSLFDHMKDYEANVDADAVKKFVADSLCTSKKKTKIKGLDAIKVKDNARFVESNVIFKPSKLKNASALLKSGEDRITITDLQKHLESHFDGIDCESKQMMENVGPRLCRFSIGLNSPYHGVELTDELRNAKNPGELVADYDESKVNYFLTMLFGYILATEGRLALA